MTNQECEELVESFLNGNKEHVSKQIKTREDLAKLLITVILSIEGYDGDKLDTIFKICNYIDQISN